MTVRESDRKLDAFRQNYHLLAKRLQNHSERPDWQTRNRICLTHGSMKLRAFSGSAPGNPPVLIVYSHVNRPFVIDLTYRHSMIQRLIETGNEVYLLDWGEITTADSSRDLSCYLHDYLEIAVQHILKRTGNLKLNMAGICQGGTFALCYACAHPERLSRLALMVTPVDFHAGDNVLARWSRNLDLDMLERFPQNMPGSTITRLFQMLRPFDDMARQVRMITRLPDAEDLELLTLMDQWIFDCPDQPGRAFAQFVKLFYQQNRLVSGGLEMAGRTFPIKDICFPVLNVYASQDHLVPPESSQALGLHIDPKHYREMVFEGGHVGLLVSQKAQDTILPMVGNWLSGQEVP